MRKIVVGSAIGTQIKLRRDEIHHLRRQIWNLTQFGDGQYELIVIVIIIIVQCLVVPVDGSVDDLVGILRCVAPGSGVLKSCIVQIDMHAAFAPRVTNVIRNRAMERHRRRHRGAMKVMIERLGCMACRPALA